jgi:hypothetical protein
MQAALKLTTRVLPGNRVEFTSPELVEGEDVELIVLRPVDAASIQSPSKFKNVLEYLNSLTPVERTPEQWAEVEREFREERNSWGD